MASIAIRFHSPEWAEACDELCELIGDGDRIPRHLVDRFEGLIFNDDRCMTEWQGGALWLKPTPAFMAYVASLRALRAAQAH